MIKAELKVNQKYLLYYPLKSATYYNMELLYLLIPLFSALPTILTIIHIIKTNRDRSWIWIVIFLSTAGVLAYFFIEILPSLLSTRQGRAIRKSVISIISIRTKISRLKKELKITSTFEKQRALADAYFELEQYTDAIPIYRECLTGLFSDSFEVQFNLAHCYFRTEQFKEAEKTIKLIKNPPGDIKKAVVKLIHAQILEKLGSLQKAEQLYKEAAAEYHGFEGTLRYGVFLKKTGKTGEAQKQLLQIIDTYPTLPSYSKRIERRWKTRAKQELRSIPVL